MQAQRRRRRPVWITWERQRRSITLASRVGATLVMLDYDDRGAWRYPLCLARTLVTLVANRGGIVYVQNPSMVLATVAALLKWPLRYTLVVDRHSNFLQADEVVRGGTARVLAAMSRYTIRRADLTIVTNRDIASGYVNTTGRAFILPDPYPEVPGADSIGAAVSGRLDLLFVSTWQVDEPIAEVMEACRRMPDEVRVFISGRPRPRHAELIAAKPANFVMTGFLPDDEYFALMGRVDGVIAVSTRPGTLCCGAYEGVSMGKPIVVSGSAITRDYFAEGAVYTDGTADSLEACFREMLAARERLTSEVRAFRERSAAAWEQRLAALLRQVDRLHAGEPAVDA